MCAISLSYVLFAFVCEQFIYISVVRHLNPYHSSIIYLKANSFRLPIQYLFSFYAFSLSQVNEFFFSSWIFDFIRSLSLSVFLFSVWLYLCVCPFSPFCSKLSQVSQFVSEANARTTFSQPKPSADVTFQKRTFRLARCLSFRFATASKSAAQRLVWQNWAVLVKHFHAKGAQILVTIWAIYQNWAVFQMFWWNIFMQE